MWLVSNAGTLGIKRDEIKWSGVNDWLDLQGKAVLYDYTATFVSAEFASLMHEG